jgi:hypothetical protein
MKNNSEDVRPSENKVSYKSEIKRGKVLAIRNKFGDFNKKNNIGRAESGEKIVRVRKEKCLEKIEKHLNFYAKQSDLTHAYHSNIPMILLLYKETYFNFDDLNSCVPSIAKFLLQEFEDIFPKKMPNGLPSIREIERIKLILLYKHQFQTG